MRLKRRMDVLSAICASQQRGTDPWCLLDHAPTRPPAHPKLGISETWDTIHPLQRIPMLTQAEKALIFQALHQRKQPFVIGNPWDAGSARILAALKYEALSTTSAGLAFT